MTRMPVTQKDDMGCGVACLAFIQNVTYETALVRLKNGRKKAQTVGFHLKELREVLGHEYKSGFAKRNRNKIYREGSIVFIRRSNKYPFGHYLVRWNKLWMDPWINFAQWKPVAGFRKRLPEQPAYVIFNAV